MNLHDITLMDIFKTFTVMDGNRDNYDAFHDAGDKSVMIASCGTDDQYTFDEDTKVALDGDGFFSVTDRDGDVHTYVAYRRVKWVKDVVLKR